jgi:hypothetical protein
MFVPFSEAISETRFDLCVQPDQRSGYVRDVKRSRSPVRGYSIASEEAHIVFQLSWWYIVALRDVLKK